MKINVGETLRFFDEEAESRGHATAIVSVIGEDLNTSVFKNYLEARGDRVKIFDGPITQGTTKGQRLDKWIYVHGKNGKNILYQCEIKNWSATAIGGRSLPMKANGDEVRKISQYHWEQQKNVFSRDAKPNSVTKVLLRMNPARNENVKQYMEEQKINNYQQQQKPLLIYWMPISSNKKDNNPFFTEKVSNLDVKFTTNFENIDIFSVSLYLRTLERKKPLSLSMPNVEKRRDILNKIIIS
ncbi:MAG TPA: hypothetical protein VJB56_01140 [Candidatus Paceibacterota bacterium]